MKFFPKIARCFIILILFVSCLPSKTFGCDALQSMNSYESNSITIEKKTNELTVQSIDYKEELTTAEKIKWRKNKHKAQLRILKYRVSKNNEGLEWVLIILTETILCFL